MDREWYQKAQALQQEPSRRSSSALADIDEEEEAPESASSTLKDSVQSHETLRTKAAPKGSGEGQGHAEQDLAAQQLRTHESLAFLSTFIFPALGAYLLHVIRGQLSQPSTNLVSDYNLTIFLLAAEIRPCRQLIRLVTKRTLHLQRVANRPDQDPSNSKVALERQREFETRVDALESKMADQMSSATGPQQETIVQLSTEMKKRYEPRLEALERALRRYEKRVTTLTMLTDQRFQTLQTRLDDALSLAAVAAHSSQRKGLIATALAWMSRVMIVPLELAWYVLVWPIKITEDIVRQAAEWILGPSVRTRGKGDLSGSDRSKRRAEKDRLLDRKRDKI